MCKKLPAYWRGLLEEEAAKVVVLLQRPDQRRLVILRLRILLAALVVGCGGAGDIVGFTEGAPVLKRIFSGPCHSEVQVFGAKLADRLQQLEVFTSLLKALVLTLASLIVKFGSPRCNQEYA
jgi:hypothetical protein